MQEKQLKSVVIASITPYFLKRDVFWFEKNLERIKEAAKTQSFFEKNIIFVEKDQKCNLSEFLRKLTDLGYEKVYKISELGEFSQKGGIIEVFPINSLEAARIDFLGNRIENIEAIGLEIKDEKKARELLEKKLKSQEIFSELKDLKRGDYLVHLDHGVGIFKGKEKLNSENYYVIDYAQNDRLFVPFGLERKLSRYVGFSEPTISRLSSLLWQKTKRKVKEETEKLAKELLEIYSQREIAKKIPCLPDDEIDFQIASSFIHEETPDQERAIQEIKDDLEKEKPMDRLLCGDVGFGKTEVALRAMIKVVKSGQQAVMLCPTTILANQHFVRFKERLKNLPIRIAILSRFQTKKEQKIILENLASGSTDILIATHRVLSKDVSFRNLGFLIIDDEHRFGVKQKEKLKKIRASLNVLSLSATPIPRTLYMSLSSLRNISLIQTPPLGRKAAKIEVVLFSEKTIKEAIEKELKREGQVYYLHNRVETIQAVKNFLEHLLPETRFDVAHGRLEKQKLTKVMDDFQKKKTDVLIATTIIENGLDIENVNTLIVANASRLGLAEIYQLKGRVGRSEKQAFAYFLYPEELSYKAKKRLKAIREAKELGSGYKIALRDMEIRGAGNILGKEQSGSVNKVGLNLYCQMLSQAIEKMKKDSN